MQNIISPKLIEYLKTKPKVAVLTGAGVSAESGVPTFRDAQTGLWARYDPLELATPTAFQNDPKLVWEWYEWRRSLVRKAQPNAGHIALAMLEGFLDDFVLITQNVDGLHQQAGSQHLIELHGNIMRTKCSIEGRIVEDQHKESSTPPKCPHCGALLRPDVVWFGETLPPNAIEKAWDAAENCELFFSIGTSAQVEPAASLPFIAKEHNAVVVEINPHTTPLTPYANYAFAAPSGEILATLVQQISGK